MSASDTQIPGFMIIGTPRSGTTLVQRLASELPGVRVPPETHFFRRLPRFRWRFPLKGKELRDALQTCSVNAGVSHPDIERMVECLGGRATGPLEIWGAVLRESAGEAAAVYGEKTPLHLWWWRPLSVALPMLRFIAVVRDPRAVVASWLGVPWGPKGEDGPARLAEHWTQDQNEIVRAMSSLGSKRCLVLRYEQAVMDPDSTRGRIAAFLDIDFGKQGSIREVTADELFRPREVWKERAVGEFTPERIQAWRQSLDRTQVRVIEAICRPGMIRFGYPVSVSYIRSWGIKLALDPRITVRRVRMKLLYRRRSARIERTRLS